MGFNSEKIKYLERITAIIVLFAVFYFIPYKILLKGFIPPDDVSRHVAFSLTDQKWSDVLIIEKGLEADHNAGWHSLLRFLHKYFRLDKEQLLAFSVISLFILVNMAGSLGSPNIAGWPIVLLVMFVFDRGIFNRLLLGRPFIISIAVTLILLKLWFVESQKPIKWYVLYTITTIVLVIAVWLHGTWYTFLLLPMSLFLSKNIAKSIKLTLLIIISTLIGAYLTGELQGFIYFHYYSTLNIFTEKIYNWQLVTEFAEGEVGLLWLVPAIFIVMLSVYAKKLKLNDLSKDPIIILIILTWLLSIKVIRFWADWGIIALMFWLSIRISELTKDMQSIKKPVFRWVLFFSIISTICILIPNLKFYNKKEFKCYSADFTQKELAKFEPDDGGIVYNDNMKQFYSQYYRNPFAKYKFVLGFEPAIMQSENKKIFREISYNDFHYMAYKPWVNKLTSKDRIFTSVDVRKYYPELDWVKVSKILYIGKTKL